MQKLHQCISIFSYTTQWTSLSIDESEWSQQVVQFSVSKRLSSWNKVDMASTNYRKNVYKDQIIKNQNITPWGYRIKNLNITCLKHGVSILHTCGTDRKRKLHVPDKSIQLWSSSAAQLDSIHHEHFGLLQFFPPCTHSQSEGLHWTLVISLFHIFPCDIQNIIRSIRDSNKKDDNESRSIHKALKNIERLSNSATLFKY